MTNPDKPKRRWYQYSIRSMLVLTTLVAIACSWYACEMKMAAHRRAVIAEIRKHGGHVEFYNAREPEPVGDPPGWFSWLRMMYGERRLGNATGVDLVDTPVGDVDLIRLKCMPDLERLALSGPRITDAQLEHLKDFAKLESLYLHDTSITDAGLSHLKDLGNLRGLSLHDTQTTDTGMSRLEEFSQLRELVLWKLPVTDAGLSHLEDLSELRELHLWQLPITDAGLIHLEDLKNLRWLVLNHTQVTDDGVKRLQKALPNCVINRDPPELAVE